MSRLRISDTTFGILCTIPGMIALLALIGYPVIYNALVSFTKYRYVPGPFVGFENYSSLLSEPRFYSSLKVAIIYCTGSTALAFVTSVILAEALSRIAVGRTLFRTLVILPWAVPLVLSGILFKWMFDNEIGVVNYALSTFNMIHDNIPFLSDPNLALLVAIVATAYIYIPFMTVIIHAGLQNIPRELYEAAQIDGADEFHKLRYITFPLNKFQMLIAGLIVWLFTFRTPDLIFSLTEGGPGKATYHIGLYLRDFIYRHVDFGRGASLGMLVFLACVIVVMLLLAYYFWAARRSA